MLHGRDDTHVLESIHRSVQEFAEGPARRGRQGLRRSACPAVSVGYCLALRLIDVFEGVVQRLALADVGIVARGRFGALFFCRSGASWAPARRALRLCLRGIYG